MNNLRGLAAFYNETFYYFYERFLEATKLRKKCLFLIMYFKQQCRLAQLNFAVVFDFTSPTKLCFYLLKNKIFQLLLLFILE